MICKNKDITVIIKPTERCNLACKYCYRPSGVEQHQMTMSTLENIFKKFLKHNKFTLRVIWHGGEPLLMGKQFFLRALEIEKEQNTKNLHIKNGVQTNGILLDDEFISIFKENNFTVGVSLDGPKYIHDRNRIYINGNGSYDDVIRGINLLLDNDYPSFGIIITLTKISINFEKEIYSFIKDSGIKNVKIGYYLPSGMGKQYKNDLYISPSEYSKFMNKFYDMWINDSDDIMISPFVEIIESFFLGKSNLCEYSGTCENFISIEPNGDIYPCGRFASIPSFKIGNINRDDITSIIKSPIRQEISRRNHVLPSQCQDCKFKDICRGGCPFESFIYFGDIYHPTPYCAARKLILNHVYADLQQKAKDLI